MISRGGGGYTRDVLQWHMYHCNFIYFHLTALLGTSTWIDIRQEGQCERDMESHAGHYP